LESLEAKKLKLDASIGAEPTNSGFDNCFYCLGRIIASAEQQQKYANLFLTNACVTL
jgi:hypothetical protein